MCAKALSADPLIAEEKIEAKAAGSAKVLGFGVGNEVANVLMQTLKKVVTVLKELSGLANAGGLNLGHGAPT